MNSLTAVLLALLLIAVVLLIVWLVLRSRTGDGRRDVATSAAATGDRPVRARDGEPHDDDATAPGRDGAAPAGQGGGTPAAAADADEAMAAEEYVEPGLSELEPGTSSAGDSAADEVPQRDDDAGEGILSGSPPRTPAEAFGPAEGTAAVADGSAEPQRSVLDDPDVDSTPLFRTVREELLGTVALDEPDRPVDSGERPGRDARSDAHDVETALADEVVAERPEVGASWSEERRAWDEQAHAHGPDEPGETADQPAGPSSIAAEEPVSSKTVTEGPDGTGAAGSGTAAPDPEEEELSKTGQQTMEGVDATNAVAGTDAPEVSGEHPPMRRISELHEVVDGGFGIGSAATIADGAQPLGHPIKANVDTKTYQDLHSPWYDETEPDVWFLDAGFAERAGFHRAD